jgi:hypothetical protein
LADLITDLTIHRLVELDVFRQYYNGRERIFELTDSFKKFSITFLKARLVQDDTDTLINKYGPQPENVLVALAMLEYYLQGKLAERDDFALMGTIVGRFFHDLKRVDDEHKLRQSYYGTASNFT